MTTYADYATRLGPQLAANAEGALTRRYIQGARRIDNPTQELLDRINQLLETCWACDQPIDDWPHQTDDGHLLHPHCCPC